MTTGNLHCLVRDQRKLEGCFFFLDSDGLTTRFQRPYNLANDRSIIVVFMARIKSACVLGSYYMLQVQEVLGQIQNTH